MTGRPLRRFFAVVAVTLGLLAMHQLSTALPATGASHSGAAAPTSGPLAAHTSHAGNDSDGGASHCSGDHDVCIGQPESGAADLPSLPAVAVRTGDSSRLISAVGTPVAPISCRPPPSLHVLSVCRT